MKTNGATGPRTTLLFSGWLQHRSSTSFLSSFSKRAVKRFVEIIGIPLLCNGIIVIRL